MNAGNNHGEVTLFNNHIKTLINDEYDLIAEDIVDILIEYEIKIRSSKVGLKLTINGIDILSYIFDELLSKSKKNLLSRCGI